MSRKVIFSPDPPTIHSSKHGGNRKKPILKIWIFRFPKGSSRFSVGNFIRNMGANVAKSLPLISTRRKCSGKVSSLGRSRSYAETLDSQRAEAIEDCIEFLNSSSCCLQRSNSVSSSC